MFAAKQQQKIGFPDGRGAKRTVRFVLTAVCLSQCYAESGCPMRMRQHAEQTNAATVCPFLS